MPLLVARGRRALHQGDELIAHVDKGAMRAPAAQLEGEDAAIEGKRLVDAAHLQGDMVDAHEVGFLNSGCCAVVHGLGLSSFRYPTCVTRSAMVAARAGAAADAAGARRSVRSGFSGGGAGGVAAGVVSRVGGCGSLCGQGSHSMEETFKLLSSKP